MRQLPLHLQNEITSFLYYSLPLCVILTDSTAENWFYENYLSVCACYIADYKWFYVQYMDSIHYAPYFNLYHLPADNPLIRFRPITQKEAPKAPEIIDFIMDQIHQNHYIVLFVDEYYLPERETYKKEHFFHEFLIYGYDSENQTLNALAFDKNYNFNPLQLNFRDFKKAYDRGSKTNDDFINENRIITMERKQNDTEAIYHPAAFLEKLRRYHQSYDFGKISELRVVNATMIAHGINVYDIYKHYFTHPEIIDEKGGSLVPSTYLLYEIRNSVYKRMDFFAVKTLAGESLQKLIEPYQEIVRQNKSIFNLYIKYLLLKYECRPKEVPELQKNYYKKILDTIDRVKDKEYSLLCSLIPKLEQAL